MRAASGGRRARAGGRSARAGLGTPSLVRTAGAGRVAGGRRHRLPLARRRAGGRRAPSGPPETSRNAALRDEGLRAYADAFTEERFLRDLATLEALAATTPTALLCAERDWRHCHRQLLADVLVARGAEVVHLLDEGRSEPHALHEWARVADRSVTYPGLL